MTLPIQQLGLKAWYRVVHSTVHARVLGIPDWLVVNFWFLVTDWPLLWILQTGIPALLANIEKGCREYEEYIKLDREGAQLPIKSPQDFCDATIAGH